MPDIDWDTESLRVLCQLFAEQTERGNCTNTHLNSVGFAEVEKGLRDRIGKVACKQQIKTKWDNLKEDFKAWKKLMLRQTGTGCGKFRKQGLQNEDYLHKCLGDIVNISNDHWSPYMRNVAPNAEANETQQPDPILNLTQEDAEGEGGDTQEVDQFLLSTQIARDHPGISWIKGKKTKTGTALAIQEAVTSMATSANSYASNKQGKFSIDEVMEHVIACGANYDTNEHFIASELFMNKEHREMFHDITE